MSNKCNTISVMPAAKKMLVAEVKRLRDLNQYANEKMLATNAIYAFLGKDTASEAIIKAYGGQNG